MAVIASQLASCRRWGLRCRNRTSQIIIYLVPLSRWHKTTWTRTVVRSKSFKLYNHNQATGFDDYMIIYIYIYAIDRARVSNLQEQLPMTPSHSIPERFFQVWQHEPRSVVPLLEKFLGGQYENGLVGVDGDVPTKPSSPLQLTCSINSMSHLHGCMQLL